MYKRLAGKNILITGASTGFGRSIALTCAVEGANLALIARSEDKLQEVAELAATEGVNVTFYVADVGIPEQVIAAVEKAQAKLGFINVLVNNAGTNVAERSIQDTSLEQWQLLMDVNVTSAFQFTKLLLPAMIEHKEGTIINISSRAAVTPSLLAGVAYSTSKIGMDALNDVTNEEGNPHNVRACIICPGVGSTPILDRRPAPPSPEKRSRMLQPEDIADTVVMVASLHQRANMKRIEINPTFVVE